MKKNDFKKTDFVTYHCIIVAVLVVPKNKMLEIGCGV
jgi:hypothetical protein